MPQRIAGLTMIIRSLDSVSVVVRPSRLHEQARRLHHNPRR
jgi:hypothetical protein